MGEAFPTAARNQLPPIRTSRCLSSGSRAQISDLCFKTLINPSSRRAQLLPSHVNKQTTLQTLRRRMLLSLIEDGIRPLKVSSLGLSLFFSQRKVFSSLPSSSLYLHQEFTSITIPTSLCCLLPSPQCSGLSHHASPCTISVSHAILG